MTYVELHQHTEFSALDGLNNVSRLATRAAELSYPALAITDHGTMGGTIRFYQACRKAGIKPILGYEAYVTLDGLPHDGWKTSSGKDEQKRHRGNTHLTLLAADHQGYQNLLKLATMASTDGFYYKPRISRSLLAEHADGLIVLSGCMGSEISKAAMNGRDSEAAALARWYSQAFPGRFFIELHQHGMVDDERLYPGMIRMAYELGIPAVAANDGHYLMRGDDRLHDVEMRVQTAGTYGGFETGEFYLKSRGEMKAMGFTDRALDMSLSIAGMCNVELELGKQEFPRPAGLPDDVVPDEDL